MKDLRDRRNKVLAMKKEYENIYNNVEKMRKKAHREYREAVEKVYKMTADNLSAITPHSDRLKFYFGYYFEEIKCDINYGKFDPFEFHTALKWDYHATFNIKTGEVKCETGSWSGLQATTDEELCDLRKSLEVLEALHKVDWKEILGSIELPDVEEFCKDIPDSPEKPMEFDEELFNIDLETAMVNGIFIQDKSILGYDVYYEILKITDKQVVVRDYVNENGKMQLFHNGQKVRMAKEKFRIKVGLKFIDWNLIEEKGE